MFLGFGVFSMFDVGEIMFKDTQDVGLCWLNRWHWRESFSRESSLNLLSLVFFSSVHLLEHAGTSSMPDGDMHVTSNKIILFDLGYYVGIQ